MQFGSRFCLTFPPMAILYFASDSTVARQGITNKNGEGLKNYLKSLTHMLFSWATKWKTPHGQAKATYIHRQCVLMNRSNGGRTICARIKIKS